MAREIVLDLRPIIGIDAVIASPTIDGAVDAAFKLAVLIDPVTHATPDGSCERCGAPAAALADAYCAHCGRRVVRDAKEEAADEAVKKIREAQHAMRAARDALTGEAIWKGFAMLLNGIVMELTNIEEIMRRKSEEGDER